jgi:hypothetical protein
MKTTKRVMTMFRKPSSELVPAGEDLRKELEKHLATLNNRIGAVGLSQHLIVVESNSWKELRDQAVRKTNYATDAQKKASLERMKAIAEKTYASYSTKDAQLKGTLKELTDIRSRVQQAISMIEVENNLRNVTSMFDGIDGIDSTQINLEVETREIRQLLHATDGLMELMA